MKQLITLLVILITTTLNAQTIETVTIQDSSFEYQTDSNGTVDAKLEYRTTKEPNNISDDILRKLIKMSTSITKLGLKSSRSFVPLSYNVKYKYNKKGRHKYSVHVYYAGTNSYGGVVESLMMLEFNRKFKETFGSVMLRSN